MEKPNIPTVYPIHEGAFVTIPYESWNALCSTINSIAEAVNAQTDAINGHAATVEALSKRVSTCDDNVTKIAQILEEVYEMLE